MEVKGKYIALIEHRNEYNYFIQLTHKIENNIPYCLNYEGEILPNKNNLKVVVKGEYDSSIKEIIDNNKLLMVNLPELDSFNFFKIDENNYQEDNKELAKYYTYISNLRNKLSQIDDDNNIYEVIDGNNFINDFKKFKHNKEDRRLFIDEPITNKVYIKYDDYLYGYFNYKIIDDYVEFTNTSNEYLNKIKLSDVENLMIEIEDKFNYHNYELVCLENKGWDDKEDFILLDELISRVVNDMKKKSKMSKAKANELKNALKETSVIVDYRKNLLEETINNQENFIDIKDSIIDDIFEDEEKLGKICKEIAEKHYGEISNIIDKYNIDIKQKEEQLNEIIKSIEEERNELEKLKSNRSKELEIKSTDKLNELKKEIDEKEEEYKKKKIELGLIEDEIKKKNSDNIRLNEEHRLHLETINIRERMDMDKKDAEYFNNKKIKAEEELQKVKDEIKKYEDKKGKEYNDMLEQAIESIKSSYEASYFDSFATSKMLAISCDKENERYDKELKKIINNRNNYIEIKYENEKDVIQNIQNFILSKAKRDISFNDIANIIICISQSFLTVFAGEPGTGKTSLCNIIGKAMGLKKSDDLRFVDVSVEKGWTSKSDFIGYFNPLTRKFDSSNENVYKSFLKLNIEAEKNINKYPFFMLLDEANLSPIEHYWAEFMNVCDFGLGKERTINLGENNICRVSDTFRFLATINYDHTTEVLSPRLIDRAWIILLENYHEIQINSLLDTSVENNDNILAYEALKMFINSENKEMVKSLEKKLSDIVSVFRYNNINVSPRVLKMIKNYCAIADNILEKENIFTSLDYAVSQKILPLINGYGSDYKNFLEELNKKLDGMSKCQSIMKNIINKGDKNMGHYSFFSR